MSSITNVKDVIRRANVLADDLGRATVVVWRKSEANWIACDLADVRAGHDVIEFIAYGVGKHPLPTNVHAWEAWQSLLRAEAAKYTTKMQPIK